MSSYCNVVVDGGETKYLKFTNKEEEFVLPNDENEVMPSRQINILTNIDSNITWSVDNEQVARITNKTSSYCMLLPVGAGTATLKASCVYNGKTYYDECSIMITGGIKKYFILSDNYIEVDFDSMENRDTPPEFMMCLDTNVTGEISWSVLDTTVARISKQSTEYCVFQVINPGTTVLTATATEDGKTYYDECEIKVIGHNNGYNVYISENHIELEASETGEPFGGEQSGELIIRSEPSDANIRIYVEDRTIAISGYEKRRGEDFYRATVTAVSPGETYLVAEVDYNGVIYTSKSKIKVLSPTNYGVIISESYIELERAPIGSYFDGKESDEIIINSVPVNCDITIYTEDSSIANVEFAKKFGENFYRATVIGINLGETYLIAKMVYGGVTYTSKCKIKVTEATVDPDPEPEPTGFTLSFNANGGSGAPAAVSNITSYVIKAQYPVRNGYTFLGWSTSATATVATYTVGSTITLTKNTTLYAVWQKQNTDEPSVDPTDKIPVSCRIVSAPVKTSYTYKIDTKADLTGMILEVTYSDGSKENITDVSKFKVSGFDTKSIGAKVITVEYEDLTVQYSINVSYTWWQWIIIIVLFGWIWY